ncbi:MAG: molybdopterin molybdotransferase MoeA [Clostridiales Family XIII bacterium]|jgi:molybdopterin molybdotransferase|nr:molybdopterin molybdotransferase MoeA [Clostridiales Family XIII bacterium]
MTNRGIKTAVKTDIDLETAIRLIVENITRLEAVEMPLADANGLVLDKETVAPLDQPPFARSPLDGYAFKAGDSIGASANEPVTLRIVDKLYAGGWCEKTVDSGEAVRLMTGAMIPDGCDCVIRQEDTDQGADAVKIYRELRPFANYCYQGEDYQKGESLLAAGTVLTPAAAALCASMGCATVRVARKPRVSVFSTGDELAEPGDALRPGTIYSSNAVYLVARLREMHAEVLLPEIIGDSKGALADRIGKAASVSDLIVTTGGVSVGEKDLVRKVLESLGAEVVFHGIAMKPGSPALFAKYKGALVLALSGNPFAAFASFELLTRPLFAVLTGNRDLLPQRFTATLATDFNKASAGRRFIRGKYADGRVFLPNGHSNGHLRSLVGCNCFVDIPAGSGRLQAGESVAIVLL